MDKIEVTKEQFYQIITIKNLNVHPFIVSGYDKVDGYAEEWKYMQHGYPTCTVFGYSNKNHFYLTRRTHNRYKEFLMICQ